MLVFFYCIVTCNAIIECVFLKQHVLEIPLRLLFVCQVGTEDGLVYLCTTQYSSEYLMTYPAHATAVNNIRWNTFVPSIFITCASEFVVKIWHMDAVRPILRSTSAQLRINGISIYMKLSMPSKCGIFNVKYLHQYFR